MRKYNNPRLLNTVVAGPGMKHPTKPHVIVGDNGEFIQGDLMDANAVGELVDQKIDDSEERIIPKIDELSEQLEQEITDREAADEDLSETIDSRIQDVVGAAPEALDTLKELADALNDDANFAATVTNELTELDERVDNNTSGISSLNTRVASLETSTSDWNENDSTSLSYIKNRTHYEEAGPGVIYEDIEGTETQSQSFTTYYYTDYTAAQHGLVAGKRYHVTIYRDGEERIAGYYTAASYPNGIVALSNAGYTTYSQYGNTIVPVDWGVRCILASNTTIRFESKSNYGTVHVIVSDNDPEGVTVKTLDEKFIPATIARTADVDLGVLKTGGVTYNSGTAQFGYGGTSGGGYVNRINLNSGYITGLTGIYSLFGAPITISGNVTGIGNITLNSGTISGVTGISGVSTISGQNGRINFSSGTLTGIYGITFANGVTLMSGVGASVTGTGAIWANNFGVSGDLLFSGNSSVQKRFGSGALPVVTFSQTIDSSREYTDIMSLGKGKALSIVDYYNENSPLQPSKTPEVNVSGNLNVTGTIYAGSTSNKISGNSGGMYITASGTGVYINGVRINTSGSIYEVAGLNFRSGGTITGANLVGNSGSISGYSNITMAYSGYLNMNNGKIETWDIQANAITGVSQFTGKYGDVIIQTSGNGKFDMYSGILETSGVTLKSGGVLTFGDGTTMSTAPTGSTGVPPILSGVRQIVGENQVQISMTGSTTGDGIDFGSAPLKNVNGITMYSGGSIHHADLAGNETNSMSGYSRITIAPSGTLNMQSGQINNVDLINVSELKGKYNDVHVAMSGNGRFNMIAGILETSGVVIRSGGTISGTLEGTIQSTTFESGNTFTTGFVDELKTALGLS